MRDTCLFLSKLSQVLRENAHYKLFLRESFATILDAVKVPNKVMSGFVDDCIMTIIKHTTFKTAIPVLIGEIKDSKSRALRERCLVRI